MGGGEHPKVVNLLKANIWGAIFEPTKGKRYWKRPEVVDTLN